MDNSHIHDPQYVYIYTYIYTNIYIINQCEEETGVVTKKSISTEEHDWLLFSHEISQNCQTLKGC